MPSLAKARLFAALAAFGAASGAGPGGVARANLRDGLVGYWKLDEAAIGAETAAADASGRNHPGAYVGGPTASTQVPPVKFANPRSVAFVRASHQAVRVAAMPAELKPAAVTISVWCLATSTDVDRSELVSGGDSYILYITKTGLGAGRRQVGSWSDVVAPVATILDGKWHHLAATIDGEALKVFFDGDYLGATGAPGPITYDLGADLWMGRYGYGTRARDFEGNLDDVAIYDRVLSAEEIRELARGAEPGVVAGPPDAGAGVVDAALEAAAEAAPEAPGPAEVPADAATAQPDAGAGTALDAPGLIETEPPPVVVAPPPVDAGAPPAIAGADAGSMPPGKIVHRYHDVPSACAAAGAGRSGDGALLLLAGVLLVSGRRRRGPASSR